MVAIRSRAEVCAVSESLKPTPPCHDGDRLALVKCTVSTGTTTTTLSLSPSPFVFRSHARATALDNIAITIRALGSAIEVTPDFDTLFVFTGHLRSLYENLN